MSHEIISDDYQLRIIDVYQCFITLSILFDILKILRMIWTDGF